MGHKNAVAAKRLARLQLVKAKVSKYKISQQQLDLAPAVTQQPILEETKPLPPPSLPQPPSRLPSFLRNTSFARYISPPRTYQCCPCIDRSC